MYLGLLVPAVAGLLVYGDAFTHGFLHWDDYPYVVENERIHLLSMENLRWAFLEHYFYNWHPLTWLTYMIEYSLWGKNAALFKLVNLVFHLVNSYLIALLTLKVLDIHYPSAASDAEYDNQRRWFAGLFTATLFAVHPLHVESVVWISELKDLLSGMFYFAALIAYINYRESGGDKRWRNLLGLAFLCALMSKSMAISLPAALVVMDIFLLKRLSRDKPWQDLWSLIREKLLYFVVSACVVVLTLISQNTEELASTGLLARLINACESLLLYFGNFLLPLNLSPFYPFSSLSLEPGLSSLGPVVILAACIVALVLVEKFLLRGVVLALVFFLVTILPVIGVIKVGEQAAADRYTYIPMAMFFIAAGCGLFRLLESACRRRAAEGLGIGLALGVIAGYAWLTMAYVPTWKTDERLWNHVNRLYPMQVATAYSNLGNIEYGKGNNQTALGLYQTALAIDSDNVHAQGNLAAVNENLGHLDNAFVLYQRLADSRGDSIQAQNISAAGMRRLNRLELSAIYYQQALQLAPSSRPQLYESALADHLIGDNDRAHQKIVYLLELHEEHRQGRILNVALLFTRGFQDRAVVQLELLRLEYPDDPQIRQIDMQLQQQQAQ